MVTTRERPERLRGAIAAGTAGRWTEEGFCQVDLVVPPSQPGTSSDAWTLSHEPERGTPVLDVVGPNPSAGTLFSREPYPRVQYFHRVETAGTYTLTESPIQPVYFAPADIIAGRIVENRAQEVIAQAGLKGLVRQMAQLVDSNLEPTTLRGGGVVYQESIEDPEDWEVAVVTKLAISRQERFDLSLRIGEALSQHIGQVSHEPLWTHVTFRLDLV